MKIIAIIFFVLLGTYLVCILLGFLLQTNLIFFPGKLPPDYRFNLGNGDEEVQLKTSDGETIHGLFFEGVENDAIIYFHGNAGDLSGWQNVAADFITAGYNILIIDYRGYGKSTGTISEKGLYHDAEAAWQYMIDKGFLPANIIIYGRSIGTGIAVELASRYTCKGLVLESPYTSLKQLAQEKAPYLFPSLWLKYHFDNIGKIEKVQSPVLFVHGEHDTLIPVSHTKTLYEKFSGTKKLLLVKGGTHNDLSSFPEYQEIIKGLFD